jgi:hypothetical protein
MSTASSTGTQSSMPVQNGIACPLQSQPAAQYIYIYRTETATVTVTASPSSTVSLPAGQTVAIRL